MDSVAVKEIYRSIQGESTFAGWPCTFVRTAGCDIRCGYCDETHAFSGGERMRIRAILKRDESSRNRRAWDCELVSMRGTAVWGRHPHET